MESTFNQEMINHLNSRKEKIKEREKNGYEDTPLPYKKITPVKIDQKTEDNNRRLSLDSATKAKREIEEKSEINMMNKSIAIPEKPKPGIFSRLFGFFNMKEKPKPKIDLKSYYTIQDNKNSINISTNENVDNKTNKKTENLESSKRANTESNISDYQAKKEEIKDDFDSNIKINEETNEEKGSSSPKKILYSVDENGILAVPLKSKTKYKKDDFEVDAISGRGAYGTVLQVHLKNDPSQKIYAVKKLDINSLISVGRLYQAYLENDILNELDSPFIVKIYGAFQADDKIHLIMDFLPKGDFQYFISQNFPIEDDTIRHYAAEMVCFLEYMQNMKLIHRDLKPQNIMIDDDYHLKVIDFGTVKKVGYYYNKKEMVFREEKTVYSADTEDIKGTKTNLNFEEDDYDEDEEDDDGTRQRGRKMTFVGTAEYISPEVIGDRPAEYGTDIWAFGVMLYQMYCDRTPFKAMTTYLTFRNIEKPQICFPMDLKIPDSAKDLILKILVVEPNKRLGGGEPGSVNDIQHLKKHPYFKKIKWKNLQTTPVPNVNQFKFHTCKKKLVEKLTINEKSNIKMPENFGNKKVVVIKEGIVNKKSSWFQYEKRYLILDSKPSLIYYHLNEEENKKMVYLNKECKAELIDNDYFVVRTGEYNMKLQGRKHDGGEWVKAINDTINKYSIE